MQADFRRLHRQDLEAIAALASRKHDGLRYFRPMPPEMSPQEDILSCKATEIVSIGGNRSGKTTILAARFAATARGIPITTWDGRTIDPRRPNQKKKTLEMWVIGYDWEHIGHTIYKLLFEPKAYKIIKDGSGQWRAFKPWEQSDKDREEEAVFAPPFIPMSEVKEIAWENKANRAFRRVELKNGNVIYAFASTGEVKAGDAVDMIWVDEKIQFHTHIPEWRARLMDHKGVFMWSTWPFSDNSSLRNMVERARSQKDEVSLGKRPEVDIAAFRSVMYGNPYLDKQEKDKALESWGEREAMARNLGEFVTVGTQIYPTFSPYVHMAYGSDPRQDDEIAKILRANNGIPPHDWCCYLTLDPGTARPAVLFGAVPPRKLWGGDDPVLVIWGEIYGKPATAQMTAEQVRTMAPDRVWQSFIIDWHAARQTPMGFATTVGQNYSEAFRAAGLECADTGVEFVPGSDHFPTRSMEVEKLLAIRLNGQPRLRIVTNLCPRLCQQMSENVKKMSKEVAEERPAPGQEDDLRTALEYLASRHPTYVRPEPRTAKTALQHSMEMIDKIFFKPKPKPHAHFGRAV